MKNSEPLVSVIMNCLNCERYLNEAIDSVRAQTYSNWEIIFWDNASNDRSASIVKEYNDPRIHYFRGDKTILVYAARNKALSQCHGEFIAFLDCDDIWMTEKLSKQIPLFDDPDVGLVFSDSLFFNDKGYERRNYQNKYPSEGNCFGNLLENYHLDIETVVLRKLLLDKYKLKFDDQFNLVGDADLFTRVSLCCKIAMVRQVLAKWRIHEESLTATLSENFITEKEIMYDKYEKQLIDIIPKYKIEFENAKNKNLLLKAFYKWRNANAVVARSILKSITYFDVKSFLLYIITFVPYKLIKSFLPIKYINL